jgi:hypothetical protein
MKRCVDLDLDISNVKFNELRKKYGITSFIDTIILSSDYEGELLSKDEIDICTVFDVNRFRIYNINTQKERAYHTGWIINRKIYRKEELIKMNIELPNNGERYFLTSEGKPVEVKKGDEPALCFFKRIKRKLEEQEKAKQETPVVAIAQEPKVVVIPEPTKRGYNLMNDHLFPKQTAKTKAASTTKPKKKETILGPDLHIKILMKTNSANIGKSTDYAKVKGLNLTSDFNSDEIIKYFFDENVLRTRFFKHELTPDYDGNPHPGKEIYQTGWIYNGDAYDIDIAYGIGLISPSKAKEYIDSGATRMVITKCNYRFLMNPEDMTFNEYLDKCLLKEGIARKKD